MNLEIQQQKTREWALGKNVEWPTYEEEVSLYSSALNETINHLKSKLRKGKISKSGYKKSLTFFKRDWGVYD